MFTDDGSLIGITVSNSKDDTPQLICPNINVSVPVYDILPILKKYGQSKGNKQTLNIFMNIRIILKIFFKLIQFSTSNFLDERDLYNLVANKEVKSVWALETPTILCKL